MTQNDTHPNKNGERNWDSIHHVCLRKINTYMFLYLFFLTRYVLTMKNELKCMLSKNSNEVVGHNKESHALHEGINGWAFVEKKNLRPMCIM